MEYRVCVIWLMWMIPGSSSESSLYEVSINQKLYCIHLNIHIGEIPYECWVCEKLLGPALYFMTCPRPLPQLNHCWYLWQKLSHLYQLANVHQVTQHTQGRQIFVLSPSLEEISGLKSLESTIITFTHWGWLIESWGEQTREDVSHLFLVVLYSINILFTTAVKVENVQISLGFLDLHLSYEQGQSK